MRFFKYWSFRLCRKSINANYIRFRGMKEYIQNQIDVEYYLKNLHSVEALKDIILDKEQYKVFELLKKENVEHKLTYHRNKNDPDYIAKLRKDILQYYKAKNDSLTEVDIKLMNYIEYDILREL
jgi:hypothetical protein